MHLKNLFFSAMIVTVMLSSTRTRADDPYLNVVRTSLDTLILDGRDRYGSEKSPLFAANLNVITGECTEETPDYELAPKLSLDRARLNRVGRGSDGGANQYFDQATFLAMVAMSEWTGDPMYREEVLKALKFNMNTAVDERGFPALGGHTFWNFRTDALDGNGRPYHEFWNWPMAWDLWWDADASAAQQYADLIWEHHVVDKKTGLTNRHPLDEGNHPFPMMVGNFITAWAKAYQKTGDEKYRQYMHKVADFYWEGRNKETNLIYGGGEKGTRVDGMFFNMGSSPMLAYNLMLSGQWTDDQVLIDMGRAYLDAYAKYGYYAEKELFYGSLTLEGEPCLTERAKMKGSKGWVNGQSAQPQDYVATWQPYVGWYEIPLPVAQVYAWAAESVDKKAYLETALRWGNVIEKSWTLRYGGFENDTAYREALLNDPEQGDRYTEDYPYTAPFGLFADHYGRTIQLALTLHRLTGDAKWQALAKEVGDTAIRDLWNGRLLVGHLLKKDMYENSDNIGILFYALLELHESLNPSSGHLPVSL